jgi:homoaconitase/3-isopropylmalate dehydratase large subunit
MEGRMTVCNLKYRNGSSWRNGAPDQTTFDYLEDVYMLQKALLGYSRSLLENIKTMQMQNLMKKSTLTLTLNQ